MSFIIFGHGVLLTSDISSVVTRCPCPACITCTESGLHPLRAQVTVTRHFTFCPFDTEGSLKPVSVLHDVYYQVVARCTR
jgi:hypothetical protein